MSRAENSGKRLSHADAAIVKGMLLRGDRQHDIAAWFGVNGGRIGEISKRKKFTEVLPETKNLPKPGPYLSGMASEAIINEVAIVKSILLRLASQANVDADVKKILQSTSSRLAKLMDDQS